MDELKEGDLIKERYRLIRFLGNGSFGEVWLAEDILAQREIAIKIYITLNPAGIQEFQREYYSLEDIYSEYLLKPTYFDVYNRRPFLIMKYCEGGSASTLVGNISESEIWRFIHDVASGLSDLHSHDIVHHDIKPDNVLKDGKGKFIITDFGISQQLRTTMRKQSKREASTGAIPYMGPEMFAGSGVLSTSYDIWSLGVSIYELASGELPFFGFGGVMLRNGVEMPVLNNNWSRQLNDLMHACMAKETWDRPTAKEIKEYTAEILEGRFPKVRWHNIPQGDSSNSEVHEKKKEKPSEEKDKIPEIVEFRMLEKGPYYKGKEYTVNFTVKNATNVSVNGTDATGQNSCAITFPTSGFNRVVLNANNSAGNAFQDLIIEVNENVSDILQKGKNWKVIGCLILGISIFVVPLCIYLYSRVISSNHETYASDSNSDVAVEVVEDVIISNCRLQGVNSSIYFNFKGHGEISYNNGDSIVTGYGVAEDFTCAPYAGCISKESR